jgi:hypothetical protein
MENESAKSMSRTARVSAALSAELYDPASQRL